MTLHIFFVEHIWLLTRAEHPSKLTIKRAYKALRDLGLSKNGLVIAKQNCSMIRRRENSHPVDPTAIKKPPKETKLKRRQHNERKKRPKWRAYPPRGQRNRRPKRPYRQRPLKRKFTRNRGHKIPQGIGRT